VTSEDDPRPFVLSLVSVGTDAERYLRSLLALLKTYLEPSWCIAARLGDLPDAVLVDMDSKEVAKSGTTWISAALRALP